MKPSKPTTVISRTCTHALRPGCHPSISEELLLPAGQAVAVPRAALAFVLSLPGVELQAGSFSAPPAPDAPPSEE